MSMTREEYRQKFVEFDKSGDGKLNLEEFKEHLSQLLRVQVSDQAAQNVFDSLNKNKDDYITVDEWLDSLDRKPLKEFGKEDIERAFNEVDTSKNGKLDKNELKAVLKQKQCQVTDEDVDAMIKLADTDHDGQISLKEFSEVFFKNV